MTQEIVEEEKMKERDKYLKLVEWSEEDQCYVGSVPGWIGNVAMATMKRKFIKSFVKLWTNGFRFTKTMDALFHRKLPVSDSQGNLYCERTPACIKLWRYVH